MYTNLASCQLGFLTMLRLFEIDVLLFPWFQCHAYALQMRFTVTFYKLSIHKKNSSILMQMLQSDWLSYLYTISHYASVALVSTTKSQHSFEGTV